MTDRGKSARLARATLALARALAARRRRPA
jgi:hypothetical protein